MTPPATRSRKTAAQAEASPDEVLGPSGTDPAAAQPPMVPTAGEPAVPAPSGTVTQGAPAGIIVEHEEVTEAGVKAAEVVDGRPRVKLRHKRGCPKERIESYPSIKPGGDGYPPREVTVVRCVDCGESDVVGELQAYDDDDAHHIISGG